MKTQILRVALLISLLGNVSISNAIVVDEWQARHPLPSAFNVFNAAYGNGAYVMLGARGALITTPDLENWHTEKRFEWLENVIFDGDRFVISGYTGDILISPDGQDWTVYSSGTDQSLSGIAYGNGRYVAAGQNGTTATSTNGMNWQIGSIGGDDWYYGVAYGNGVYVAVGVDGNFEVSGSIATTTDGVNWNLVNLPAGLPPFFNLWDVDYGNGKFVAVGYGWDENSQIDGVFMLTSEDGTNWTHINSPNFPNSTFSDSTSLNGVRYDSVNSLWVATGDWGLVMTSTDGETWTVSNPPVFTGTDFYALTFGPYGTTLVGNRGNVFSSTDLTDWTENSSGSYVNLIEIAFHEGRLLAASTAGQYVTSIDDGQTWVPGNFPLSGNVRDIVFGNGYWVVGNDSAITTDLNPLAISQDGVTWSWPPTYPEDFQDSKSLAFGNGIFVALPGAGENSLITSTDAQTWTGTSHPWFTEHQQNVFLEFGGGQFVAFAVGNPNVEVAVSSNGTDWQEYDTGTTTTLRAAAYGGGRWIFVGNDGQVLTTTDFQSWNEQTISFGANDPVWLEGIAYGAGHWIITGRDHSIWSSEDGLNWEEAFITELQGTNAIFYKALFDGNTFWTVGRTGVIYQSEALPMTELIPPTLAIERTATPDEYLLRINGVSGQTWDLIHSPMLPATSWDFLQSIPLTSDQHSETILAPQGVNEGYLQLREPAEQ